LKLLKEVQARYERHEALGKDVAGIYAGLGDKDQVFIWLERNDPRFTDLLRRMGLRP
jgi:hypothetical protein